MNYIYFIVEGHHDTAALGKILTENQFTIVREVAKLDKYWNRMIPSRYPINDDLLERPPHPTFYQRENFSIAIHTAGSIKKIVKSLSANLKNLDFLQLKGVGLFVDADNENPINCCQNLIKEISDCKELDTSIKQLFTNVLLGEVQTAAPCKTGIYIFPDNLNQGTLEDLLVSCAEHSYNDLLTAAKRYVDSVDVSYRNKYWSVSSEKKVLVGCIANVLQPGNANQVTIRRDDWLCVNNMHLESVEKLYRFVKGFIG